MKIKGSRNKKGVKKILNKWGYYEIFEPKKMLIKKKKGGIVVEHCGVEKWHLGRLITCRPRFDS